MEETFTFNEGEKVSEDFVNKLNSNYSIKEIKFELDHETTITDCIDVHCLIDGIPIGIITNFPAYYSNIIILNYYPFKDKNFNVENMDIQLYTNSITEIDMGFEKLEVDTSDPKSYVKCHITLKYNNIFMEHTTFTSYFERDVKNIKILSNCFNNYEDLKLFFINWNSSFNEINSDNFFNIFLNSCNIHTDIVLQDETKESYITINFNNSENSDTERIIYEIK